jgi:hypothetical protein
MKTAESPPRVLEIYRDFLEPGREAEYRTVEEDAARICADLKCPHPHLAIESLTGPKEVWWLNGFESEAEMQRVVQDYANNQALSVALAGIGPRKEGLVGTPMDIFARYRPDLSRATAWRLTGARFVVVIETKEDIAADGSVFEAPDATRFVLTPVATRGEAEIAAANRSEARVFAVRPYWGMPAKEWIAADPEFWKPNPRSERLAD